MSRKILEINNLSIAFLRNGVEITPVRSVALEIRQGERVALVGESGCGKSLTALSIMQLPPVADAHCSGSIRFGDIDTLKADKDVLRSLRGREVAYVFQDPLSSLNPLLTVSYQIGECLSGTRRVQRKIKVLDLLRRTGFAEPHRVAHSYPCELSGGQQQRVMLAMALAARPRLLIADEPTTALDVTTQAQVLDLIDEMTVTYNMAVLLITHNLGIVAGRADRVYVMYAGRTVENGGVRQVLTQPLHPYTRGLLSAVPLLDAESRGTLQDIPGTVPPATARQVGCAFAPRCSEAVPVCLEKVPLAVMQDNQEVCCQLYTVEKPR